MREHQRRWKGHATQPPGRLSRRQELALFVVMMIVLVGLITYGLSA